MLDFLGYTIAYLFLILLVVLLFGTIVSLVVLLALTFRNFIEEWRNGDGK